MLKSTLMWVIINGHFCRGLFISFFIVRENQVRSFKVEILQTSEAFLSLKYTTSVLLQQGDQIKILKLYLLSSICSRT
jgi:hypothetical protein